MAYLNIPREILAYECFQHLQGAGEIAGMFDLIGYRYGELASKRSGRTLTATNNPLVFDVTPSNQAVIHGTQFAFIYYTLSCRAIIFGIFVHRNMQLLPMHDILKILQVDYSTVTIDANWMAAYWDPSSLSYAANTTMTTGKVVSEGYIVPTAPELVIDRDPISPGSDVSKAGAPMKIYSKCKERKAVANPNDVVARFNLNLRVSQLTPQVQNMLNGL